MNIIVTGAAGFIGSTLVDSLLLDESAHVTGVDSLTDYYDPAIKKANLHAIASDRFNFVEQDINETYLKTLLDDAEVVFHLAGQPGVRGSWGNSFEEYGRRNILATQRLLEACREAPKLRRFVYASSSSVYGNADRYPTRESDVPAPMSPYGVSKLAGEHLVSLYAKNFAVPTVALRFFTVYGPRQRPDMAFHRFITDAISGVPLEVYGDGNQIREFTHVDDIVRALILASFKDTAPGSVMNVSGGTSISVNEVISVLERLLGKSLRVERSEHLAGDVFRTGGSTQLVTDVLGWEPKVSIELGLRSEIDWMQKSNKAPASSPIAMASTAISEELLTPSLD